MTRKVGSDKNILKAFSKILSNILMLAYVTFALSALSTCPQKEDSSTIDHLASSKKTTSLMLHKFDAEIFNISPKQILMKSVVFDSSLISIITNEGQIF